MILFFILYVFTGSQPKYSVIADTIVVSGSGEVTKEGIISVSIYDKVPTIIIEEGITSVKDSSFDLCAALQYVKLPSTLNSITGYAFYRAANLKFIEVSPKNTKYINDSRGALLSSDLESLIKVPAASESFEFNSRTNYLETMAFQAVIMDKLVISRFIKRIEVSCFHATIINHLSFEANSQLESISQSVFRYCTILHITLPASLQSIGSNVDYIFVSVKTESVSFEEGCSLYKIDPKIFTKCNMSRIELPSKVKEIPINFAVDCPNLEYALIPRDCQSIHPNAFSNCPKLTVFEVEPGNLFYSSYNGVITTVDNTSVVFIPPTKEEITLSSNCVEVSLIAIHNAQLLTKIIIPDENMNLTSDNGLLYDKEKTVLIGICGGVTSASLPNSVTKVSNAAGELCTKLTSLDMSKSSVTIIKENSFQGCPNLKTVKLSPSLLNIGDFAFNDCSKLDLDLSVCTQLKTISQHAFQSTNLTKLILGNTVEYIGKGAFNGCFNLATVVLDYSPDCFVSSEIFLSCGITSLTIGNSVKTLTSRMFDSGLKTNIVFRDSPTLKSIKDSALRLCHITELFIPKSVESISSKAFEVCRYLTTVTFDIDNKMQEFNLSVFNNCDVLSKIIFPKQVSKLNPGTFKGCNALTDFSYEGENLKSDNGLMLNKEMNAFVCCPYGRKSVVVESYIERIEKGAFSTCILSSITFETNKLLEIPDSCFMKCSKIASIHVPSSIINISESAFYQCTSLQTIKFDNSNSLQKIKDSAFFGCSSLQLVSSKNLSSIQSIDENAFYGCTKFNDFEFSSSTLALGSSSFSGCSSLLVAVFPSINEIPISCFEGCSSLFAIDFLGKSNQNIIIRERAFAGTGFRRFYIPPHATALGQGMLEGSPYLEAIVFCGTQPNADNATITLVAASDMKKVKAYVVKGYTEQKLYGLDTLKVLRDDCTVIERTATASTMFTVMESREAYEFFFIGSLFDLSEE